MINKLGKGHLSQMRYIHLFIENFINIFAYKIIDFIRFDSEMVIRNIRKSNLFLITYRTLIFNVWAASMRLK